MSEASRTPKYPKQEALKSNRPEGDAISRAKQFTEIAPVVMKGFPDAHHAFLKIEGQRFCVTPYGCETKEGAEWMREMLAIALAKIGAALARAKGDNQ